MFTFSRDEDEQRVSVRGRGGEIYGASFSDYIKIKGKVRKVGEASEQEIMDALQDEGFFND